MILLGYLVLEEKVEESMEPLAQSKLLLLILLLHHQQTLDMVIGTLVLERMQIGMHLETVDNGAIQIYVIIFMVGIV